MEIELADAVAAVRDELLEAAARAAGAEVEFVVGPIELEFGVELKRDVKAKTGFKAWVVSGDLEGGVTQSRIHKVKVTLTPRRPDGGDWHVTGAGHRRDLDGHIGR